jgi:ribonuclease VapC
VIVDSSAVLSIFLRRPGHQRLIEALAAADRAGIGAPTLAEAAFQLGLETGRDVHGLIARFVQEFDLEVVPFSEAHSRAAIDAWRRYGRGRGKAALGFGDCLAYAVARLAHQPLLTAEERFARTDLELATAEAAAG